MLIGLLIIWLMTATELWLITVLASGVRAQSADSLRLSALVQSLINAFIRPLSWVLTLPLAVFTSGLFVLLIKALMVKITASLVSGIEIDTFSDALLAADANTQDQACISKAGSLFRPVLSPLTSNK